MQKAFQKRLHPGASCTFMVEFAPYCGRTGRIFDRDVVHAAFVGSRPACLCAPE
ncbi:hypothetical protein K2O51_01145 [Cupriavidus pinatubonensis]|uniref:hypothetical protein n=1 Tax=Cupriavidus pinatubonensis TaxID=248026 RepID=UPI0015E30B42|nr:hypothetical protein [Cupriavidus pinatubonensis]QYY28862.1 hypothetical protein K2O51_01145 [Cupriavidus pinatubonensis]